MIEKGMTPPLVLPDEGTHHALENYLRWGTIMVFLGIGLGLGYFVFQNSARLVMGGVIVGFTGFGQLVYYFIARNRHPANAR